MSSIELNRWRGEETGKEKEKEEKEKEVKGEAGEKVILRLGVRGEVRDMKKEETIKGMK